MPTKSTKETRKIFEKVEIEPEDKEIIAEYVRMIAKSGINNNAGFLFSIPSGEMDDPQHNALFGFTTVFKNFEITSKKGKTVHITYPEATATVKGEARIGKQKEIEKSITTLFNNYEKLLENQENVNKKIDQIKDVIFDIISEKDYDEKIQFLPVSIYIDTDDNKEIFEVYQSVLDLIKAIGFEPSIDLNAIKGSWFKRFIAKSKSVMTDKEVTDRLKELEYAVEVKILKDQSEVDKNQSEALINILKSVETISNAAIKIGSILVVKQQSDTGEALVQVRTLSILELHLLNKRPDLLLKPKEIFTSLAKMIEESEEEENRLN